jgi:hypothetical protein
MYRDVTFAKGVTRASIAAGPVFLASAALVTTASAPQAVAVDASSLLLLFLVAPAIVIGGLLALLPTLIGTALLANIAGSNAGARLPAFWGLVGGLVAGGGATMFEDVDGVTTAAFAATGAICALICRSGTRWPDG